jgi:hypothetical protein
MQRKCRQCSKLSSLLKGLYCRFIGKSSYCKKIFSEAPLGSARVERIYFASPRCACERFQSSSFSPRPVGDNETITRFVFSPMHTTRQGFLKPNFFSNAETEGCSSQREDMATDDEMSGLVKHYMTKKPDTAWLGYVSASARAIRDLTFQSGDRAVCLYDAGLLDSPAHTELYQSRQRIEEADGAEVRSLLYKLFGGGPLASSEDYRNGQIWRTMSQEWTSRTVAIRNTYEKKQKKART